MAQSYEGSDIIDLTEEEITVDMLDEARRAYTDKLPPFIQHEIVCLPGNHLQVTLATRAHQPPALPLSKLTCRSWDQTSRFWTLDEDGLRHIVKGFKAVDPPNMIAFHIWLGTEDGFGLWTAAMIKRNDVAFVAAFDIRKDFSTRQQSVFSLYTGMPSTTLPGAQKRKRGLSGSGSKSIVPQIRRRLQYDSRPQVAEHQAVSQLHQLKKEAYRLELSFCKETLNEMRDSKHIFLRMPFADPVDWVTLKIPEYPKIIKWPMDLGTMEKKLAASEYRNAKHFELDMRLMFNNCYLFNATTDLVYQMGKRYEAIFDAKWAQKDQWLKDHAHLLGRWIPAPKVPNSKIQTTAPPNQVPSGILSSKPSLSRFTRAKPSTTPAATAIKPTPSAQALPSLPSTILNNTRLHIFLGPFSKIKSPGTTTVYLSSCPTLDLFFSTILVALKVQEADIEAVTVRCEWLADGGSSIQVVRELPDTWRWFLECVREAACWTEDGGVRKGCDCRVTVVLRDG